MFKVVFANAKILILKLITTCIANKYGLFCCICQCKDTNFKANHNSTYPQMCHCWVVFANAKILILKLITTDMLAEQSKEELYLPMQRY